MKPNISLGKHPNTMEYLDVSQGENCPLMLDLSSLQEILPNVVMASETDDSLVKASIVISYTINSLREIWDELRKGDSV